MRLVANQRDLALTLSSKCLIIFLKVIPFIESITPENRRITYRKGTRRFWNDHRCRRERTVLHTPEEEAIMSIKLIVTDLDQTLLRSDKTISGYTMNVLDHCRANGTKLVYATARSIMDLPDDAKQLTADGLCLGNGSVLIAGGQVITRHYFELPVQNAIFAAFMKESSVYRFSAKSEDRSFYYGKSIDPSNIPYDFPPDDTRQFSSVAVRSTHTESVLAILRQYENIRYYCVTGEDLISVLPGNVSKWNGVKLLAEYWQIPIEDIVAFGDDYNDIELIKNCGIGVAVANGLEEMKVVADDICCSNDEDGVAKWLEKHYTKSKLTYEM
jgi:Cof subfamily protein (haloacid dehalogenase superfamily)